MEDANGARWGGNWCFTPLKICIFFIQQYVTCTYESLIIYEYQNFYKCLTYSWELWFLNKDYKKVWQIFNEKCGFINLLKWVDNFLGEFLKGFSIPPSLPQHKKNRPFLLTLLLNFNFISIFIKRTSSR